jgi:hypothetical protein
MGIAVVRSGDRAALPVTAARQESAEHSSFRTRGLAKAQLAKARDKIS